MDEAKMIKKKSKRMRSLAKTQFYRTHNKFTEAVQNNESLDVVQAHLESSYSVLKERHGEYVTSLDSDNEADEIENVEKEFEKVYDDYYNTISTIDALKKSIVITKRKSEGPVDEQEKNWCAMCEHKREGKFCDHCGTQLQVYNTEDAESRKQVRSMKFKELPKEKFIRVLDKHPETVMQLAIERNFAKESLEDMEDMRSGRGQPHIGFIKLIQSKDFSISAVKDALICAEISKHKIEEIFGIAEENNYLRFSDFTEEEIQPLYSPLRANAKIRTKPCWRHVATYLNMVADVEYIENTAAAGGMCSIGKAFCNIITGQNTTIGQFQKELAENLNNLCEVHKEAPVKIILDALTDAISLKIQIMRMNLPIIGSTSALVMPTATDSTPVLQKRFINIYFSLEVLKEPSFWNWAFSLIWKDTSKFTPKDLALDSPLRIEIRDHICAVFLEYTKYHCPDISTDVYHIKLDGPSPTETANYLQFKLIIETSDGKPIPFLYNHDGTPESRELWKLLKSCIKEASKDCYYDVQVSLHGWKINSLTILISLTKDMELLWEEDESHDILERIEHNIHGLRLPHCLQLVKVVPDSYIKYTMEVTSYEDVLQRLVNFFPVFEEMMVNRVVNKRPGMSRRYEEDITLLPVCTEVI